MPSMPSPLEYAQEIINRASPTLRATLLLRSFAWWRVPLLAYAKPEVVAISPSACTIKIPYIRRTKNHLNSLYFGAFAIGAEAAVGLLAVFLIQEKKLKRIDFQFKEFTAKFHKRAMGDVHFICKAGTEIDAQINQVVSTGERQNRNISVYAIVPDISDEVVAEFTLVLSLKQK